MTTRATQAPSLTGTVPTWNNAASGDKFLAGPTTRIHVKNTNGSDRTVTPTVTKHVIAGDTVTIPAVTIPATTGEMVIGPFPAELFGDADRLVSLTWSATAGVTWSVFS